MSTEEAPWLSVTDQLGCPFCLDTHVSILFWRHVVWNKNQIGPECENDLCPYILAFCPSCRYTEIHYYDAFVEGAQLKLTGEGAKREIESDGE